jgi:hypothetical protein
MIAVLAHLTPAEYPGGVALFLAGVGVGIAASTAFFLWRYRSR